jgi:DNA invertase Pin-like site-specific DNA recombinase
LKITKPYCRGTAHPHRLAERAPHIEFGGVYGTLTVHFHKEQLLFTGEVNPMQDLMLSLLGSVAQFERAMIRERQREGIAKAKEAGVYKGRAKTVDDAAIRAAMQNDGASFRKVAKVLSVSLSSVQRAMKAEHKVC